MEAPLLRHDWLNHWPLAMELNLQFISPPWQWAWGWKSHIGLHTGNQLPSLGAFQVTCLIWRAFNAPSTQEIPRGSGASSGQQQGLRPNNVFLSFFLFILAVPSFSCGMWDLVPWSEMELQAPWIGSMDSWALNHWTTREVPKWYISYYKS